MTKHYREPVTVVRDILTECSGKKVKITTLAIDVRLPHNTAKVHVENLLNRGFLDKYKVPRNTGYAVKWQRSKETKKTQLYDNYYSTTDTGRELIKWIGMVQEKLGWESMIKNG